jgi:gamma-glutamylcyclotransferase (GGCT)/AIG2-like uncharacterized protein YtfP
LKVSDKGLLTRCLARLGYGHPFALTGPGDFLVVYGSLLRGQPFPSQLNLEESLKFVEVRAIAGALYDLGDYTAFVHGSGVVHAELYRILDISVLSRLDEFEDYDPSDLEQSLYLRTAIELPRYTNALIQRLFRDATIDAWIYVYNQPLDDKTRIDARSWPEHLATRRVADGRSRGHGSTTL